MWFWLGDIQFLNNSSPCDVWKYFKVGLLSRVIKFLLCFFFRKFLCHQPPRWFGLEGSVGLVWKGGLVWHVSCSNLTKKFKIHRFGIDWIPNIDDAYMMYWLVGLACFIMLYDDAADGSTWLISDMVYIPWFAPFWVSQTISWSLPINRYIPELIFQAFLWEGVSA